jgi:starch phosphorylase
MDKLKPFLCRVLPDWLEPLTDLALDLRWTWNHGGDTLWQTIDPQAWEATQNPWWILQSLSDERIIALGNDLNFRDELGRMIELRESYLKTTGWCKGSYLERPFNPIAYFSMGYFSRRLPENCQ